MRLTAVDALRGAVMVIMALDHVRDFVHAGAMTFSPEDLSQTTPLLFFTRWVTHICAPTFVFLAGVGAYLRLQRDGSPSRISRFLWTRRLWLVMDSARRRTILLATGAGALVLFGLLRAVNLYGDPSPWSSQPGGSATFEATRLPLASDTPGMRH